MAFSDQQVTIRGKDSLGNHPQIATDTSGKLQIDSLTGLEIPAHDYISMSYTGANLTGVVYKTGGASGPTVATLTLGYDGSDNLTSVTKS
jgi:hypothetical protein